MLLQSTVTRHVKFDFSFFINHLIFVHRASYDSSCMVDLAQGAMTELVRSHCASPTEIVPKATIIPGRRSNVVLARAIVSVKNASVTLSVSSFSEILCRLALLTLALRSTVIYMKMPA